jgi:hypothetical protein
MKKITLLTLLMITLATVSFGQKFETAPYECWVDSLIKQPVDSSIKPVGSVVKSGNLSKFQFYNSDSIFITKNGNRAEVIPTKKGKAKIIDKRIIIKPLTKGQVEKIELKKDTTVVDESVLKNGKPSFDGDGNPIVRRKMYINTVKVFYVRFDSKVEIPAIPFTFGAKPSSETIPFILLNNNYEFKDKNDKYQVEGASTLQLDSKLLQELKIAKGKKVSN